MVGGLGGADNIHVTHAPAPLERRASLYVTGIIVLGVAVAGYSVYDLVQEPVGPEWLIVVALTVASGWATLRIPATLISFSISDIFNIAAALLFGPSAGAITAAIDGLVLSARMETSERSLHRVLFNMAAVTIPLWVAAQVFFAIEGNRPRLDGPLAALRLLAALLLFGTLGFGLNSGIVAAAVGFERRLPILSIWRGHLAGVWIAYFGGIFGAMLVILLAPYGTLETLILIAPLPIILYVTFRHALGRASDHVDHLAKVNRVYVGAIEALAHAVDAKDAVTHDHTRRVQDRAVHLARVLGVEDDNEVQAIKAASLLHDVGKLAVPEHILNKPGRLTTAEYDIIKRHAPVGAEILGVIGFPFAVAPIVRHHHENWDGTGYPDGLAGEQIPVGSRIIAVVDCFDALISDRPYRPRMTDLEALQILTDRRGTMYDPRVVDTFFGLHESGSAAGGAMPAVPHAAAPVPARHSALQTPLRSGEEQGDDDLQALFDLGRALGPRPSLAEVGESTWQHLKARLPAIAFVLFAYDQTDDSIVAVFKAGDDEGPLRTTRIPLGERLSGWVAATGQIVVNSDARLDLDESARAASPLRSALAGPIASNGRSIAVLSFYSCDVNAFDETHRRLLASATTALARTWPSASLSPARMA